MRCPPHWGQTPWFIRRELLYCRAFALCLCCFSFSLSAIMRFWLIVCIIQFMVSWLRTAVLYCNIARFRLYLFTTMLLSVCTFNSALLLKTTIGIKSISVEHLSKWCKILHVQRFVLSDCKIDVYFYRWFASSIHCSLHPKSNLYIPLFQLQRHHKVKLQYGQFALNIRYSRIVNH